MTIRQTRTRIGTNTISKCLHTCRYIIYSLRMKNPALTWKRNRWQLKPFWRKYLSADNLGAHTAVNKHSVTARSGLAPESLAGMPTIVILQTILLEWCPRHSLSRWTGEAVKRLYCLRAASHVVLSFCLRGKGQQNLNCKVLSFIELRLLHVPRL